MIMLISSMLVASAHAYNTPPVRGGVVGNYLEVEFGSTRIHAQNEFLPDDNGNIQNVRPSGNGFGLRLSWGYQFSEYLALEGGYSYYSPAVYNIPNGNSPEFRFQTIDIMGKAILPLYWGLSVFGKAGPAFALYKQAGLLAPPPSNNPNGKGGMNSITVRPDVAVGVNYAFSPNWSVDVSWSRILGAGIVPATDMYGIGLSYHAVDLYCGQFLC